MFFGFFQQGSADRDDDIATGTYADGMVGTPLSDPSLRRRERSLAFRYSADERDYGTARAAGQAGAGMVA